MSTRKIEKNDCQEYADNELVVETDHLRLVMSKLGQQPPTDSDGPLGLTKICFENVAAVDTASDHLRSQLPADVVPPRQPAPNLHIERLVIELRALCGAEYGNWIPVIGKNRLVRGVELFPYAWGGGEGSPVRVDGTGFDLPPRAGGRPVQVGLLDTKLYLSPLLSGRYVGSDTVLIPTDGRARHWWSRARRGEWLGHATFIAGLILDRAPMANLDVRSVLNDEEAAAPVWDVAKAIASFKGAGVAVINLSFGCYTFDSEAPLVLQRAVSRLVPDVVVVASAGNHGKRLTAKEQADAKAAGRTIAPPNAALWPAAMPDVVAVGASDRTGNLAPFNPKAYRDGPDLDRPAPWTDLIAPGVDVVSTYLDERVKLPEINGEQRTQRYTGYARWSGTSFAAAAVTGAVAGIVSKHGGSAAEALERLRGGINDKAADGIWAAPGRP